MMNKTLAAALILLLPALTAMQAQARDPRRDNSPYDSSIRSGMDYIRDSGSDGKAMYRYIKKDPVPVTYGDLPMGVQGLYRSQKKVDNAGNVVRDDSKIVLNRSLRGAPSSQIGEVLYHEYVHRAQDQSGRPGDKSLLKHSKEGFDKAQGHIRGDGRTLVSRGYRAPKAPLRRVTFSNSPDSTGGLTLNTFRTPGTRSVSARRAAGKLRPVRSFSSRSSRRISRRSHTRGAARSPRRVMRAIGGGGSGPRTGASTVSARRAASASGRTFRAVY